MSLIAQLVKNLCNSGDSGSIPESERSTGEGIGYSLQYSGLENSMDYMVHGGPKELDTIERLSLSDHKKKEIYFLPLVEFV